MSGIVGFTSAVSAFKALKDMAESLLSVRDAKAFEARKAEFQKGLMDAQASVFEVNQERTALIKRVGDLEKQIADMEAWETEKQRYELKQISDLGTFAYVLKEGAPGGEPIHQICAACYQSGKKSLLQPTTNVKGARRTHACPACHTEFLVG